MAGPLVDRAVDETWRVLGRAGLATGALSGILLVGGSSRIPLVASRLHARFQVPPTVPEQPELPVAYGGLLVGWPTRTGPTSPASGPSGPVSAAPYQVSPVTGTGAPFGVPVGYGGGPVPAPPAAWSPESAQPPPRPPAWAPAGPPQPAPAQPGAAQPGAAAQPGLLTWPAAQPPGAVPAPVPAPAPVRRRALVRGLITTAVVVALAIGLSYGGVQLFGAAKKAVGNLPGIGTAGGAGGGAQGGSGGGLAPVGAPIDLSGDGARSVAAGANLVFYAVSGNGKTVVHAVDPATGREKWAQSVVLDPSEASMHTVGDLLVVDGKASATDAGKDMRVVLQTGDGKLLQKLDWSRREDVAYLGTDAIVATTWEPYQTVRVNLRTGQTLWKSPPIASINAEHPVNPELTWTAGPADVAAPIKGFTESFGVNPNRFVQIDGNEGTAQVINGAGKVTASGKVGLDDPINQLTWTAFDGLVIGALNDTASPGRAALAGYRLDGLRKAWEPIGLSAGDEIKYVHPCAEHLVCVAYQSRSTDTQSIFAVDTTTGRRINWTSPPPYGDTATDPYWLVLGNRMLYGDGTFPPHLSCGDTGLLILDPNTGAATQNLVGSAKTCSAQVQAGAGRYLAVRDLKVAVPSGTVTWQVSVIDVSTGKRTDGLDLGTGDNPPADLVAISGTTVAAVGTDHKLRIANASKLA
ncbi:MAG: hypothetical protein E6G35_00140 [Actinobacteria bacterium]|nr:MAG: hypothetical protein E6G35_00140 [Actinomycetota bacterium]